ncbi:MAG: hypothetical protein WBR17_00945 [Paraburkholderia sp.]|uniref:hypothetical protein n=1 Tax=Paraburkholderia sp. TaxID=1926495 RepID=UPI003C673629
MAREEVLIGLLGDELQRMLNPERYVVDHSQRSDWVDAEYNERPDLVVWPTDDSKRLFLIEVKLVANSNVDLALAVAGQMLRIANAYQLRNPVLVLATNASVSDLLRSELEALNIELVRNAEREGLVADLASMIVARRKEGILRTEAGRATTH